MFEELNQHRAAVAEQIQKACEIGFTGNELEKAHKVGDVHPNGKWVWTQLPSGKYDWRVIKKTGGSASGGGAAPQGEKKQSNAKTEKMKEYVNILKQSPYHRDSERQFELMSDSELKTFRDFAYKCSQDKENLNQRTREECAEWNKLAKKELEYRGRAQRRHRQTEEYKKASESAKR